uniref:Uncharacterized protein n=1 Tax=Anopheles farauti TaxID=69004 RepID=A0A182QVV4_9DIPT
MVDKKATVVLVVASRGPGPVSGAGARFRQRHVMGGLGVLHFRRLDRHTVVDDRDVLRVVGVGMGGSVSAGLGHRREVGGLGVLHLRRLDRHTVLDHGDVLRVVGVGMGDGHGRSDAMMVVGPGGGVGGGMGGLSVGHFGRIGDRTGRVSVSERLGVGGRVFRLGVRYFRRIERDAIVAEHDRGGRRVRPWCVERALVEARLGRGMGGEVGRLGRLHFRRLDRRPVMAEDDRGVGVRVPGVVRDMGVGDGVRGRSLRQVRARHLEPVDRIGRVLHALDVPVRVDVRVATVRDTVRILRLVLLRVRLGVAVRVATDAIVRLVLRRQRHTEAPSGPKSAIAVPGAPAPSQRLL